MEARVGGVGLVVEFVDHDCAVGPLLDDAVAVVGAAGEGRAAVADDDLVPLVVLVGVGVAPMLDRQRVRVDDRRRRGVTPGAVFALMASWRMTNVYVVGSASVDRARSPGSSPRRWRR